MSNVNINGTYLFGQKCLQHMNYNKEGYMLVISPPIEMLNTDEWWCQICIIVCQNLICH